MTLTTCMVIYNEEKLLDRSLSSIKDISDETIVVHDGSCKDKSLEIARRFGAKVFIRPFIGEAEHHRPFFYKIAQGEWVLQIDADEFLSKKAKNEISTLIRTKDVDAYSFWWPYYGDKEYIKKGPFAKTFKPCLFRKEKMFMIGISHEYPRTYGKMSKRPDILLEHQPGYNNYTREAFQSKWVNWAKLQAKQIYEIEKAPTFNIPNLLINSVYQYYVFMRKFPILSGIQETLKFIYIYLTRGILWSGKKSLKISYFELRYIWLVRKYLLFLKYGRKI